VGGESSEIHERAYSAQPHRPAVAIVTAVVYVLDMEEGDTDFVQRSLPTGSSMVETEKRALADLWMGKGFLVIVVSAKAAADAEVFRAEASFQTHARGVLALPVGTQVQVRRLGLRFSKGMMVMVPPCAARAGTPGASARDAD
jgi:hypothetical protein